MAADGSGQEGSYARDAVPERDVWRAGEKISCTLDKSLDMRLLHVRTEKRRLVRPLFDEHDCGQFGGVLKDGDALAIRFQGKDGGDECAQFSHCKFFLAWLNPVLDHYNDRAAAQESLQGSLR